MYLKQQSAYMLHVLMPAHFLPEGSIGQLQITKDLFHVILDFCNWVAVF